MVSHFGFSVPLKEMMRSPFCSPAVSAELREKIGADIVAAADDNDIDGKLNATAQTPTRGVAKEFTEIMARQRAHIAVIAKALDLKPTR